MLFRSPSIAASSGSFLLQILLEAFSSQRWEVDVVVGRQVAELLQELLSFNIRRVMRKRLHTAAENFVVDLVGVHDDVALGATNAVE